MKLRQAKKVAQKSRGRMYPIRTLSRALRRLPDEYHRTYGGGGPVNPTTGMVYMWIWHIG